MSVFEFMLVKVEDPVLDALGCDFVLLPGERDLSGLPTGKTKPFTFWDGQTFEVPADFNPVVDPDGKWTGTASA